MAYPMGEKKEGFLGPDFSRRLVLDLHGAKPASGAGLLPSRELNYIKTATSDLATLNKRCQ